MWVHRDDLAKKQDSNKRHRRKTRLNKASIVSLYSCTLRHRGDVNAVGSIINIFISAYYAVEQQAPRRFAPPKGMLGVVIQRHPLYCTRVALIPLQRPRSIGPEKLYVILTTGENGSAEKIIFPKVGSQKKGIKLCSNLFILLATANPFLRLCDGRVVRLGTSSG